MTFNKITWAFCLLFIFSISARFLIFLSSSSFSFVAPISLSNSSESATPSSRCCRKTIVFVGITCATIEYSITLGMYHQQPLRILLGNVKRATLREKRGGGWENGEDREKETERKRQRQRERDKARKTVDGRTGGKSSCSNWKFKLWRWRQLHTIHTSNINKQKKCSQFVSPWGECKRFETNGKANDRQNENDKEKEGKGGRMKLYCKSQSNTVHATNHP